MTEPHFKDTELVARTFSPLVRAEKVIAEKVLTFLEANSRRSEEIFPRIQMDNKAGEYPESSGFHSI